MKLKPISKAILAAAAAASIMPFAAQAADVNVYGVVATGLITKRLKVPTTAMSAWRNTSRRLPIRTSALLAAKIWAMVFM